MGKYLIFEGEYKNGQRNGEGKEYNWNGELMFEGEYLNGKGKEYYLNDILKFEGEYLKIEELLLLNMMKMVIFYIN